MSDLPPPKPPLTEEQKDAIFLRLDGTLGLIAGQVRSLGAAVADHDKRIVVLEKDRQQRLEQEAGVGVDVAFDASPSHLSPPPPPHDFPAMRGPMSTHESLGRIAAETAAQTPMIQKAVETSQAVVEANKMATARWVGAVLAAAVLYLSQNCAVPPHFLHQNQPATIAPAPAASH